MEEVIETGSPPEDIVQKALDELKATVETKVADFDKLTKRLDAVEVKLARPGVIKSDTAKETVEIERKAFTTFLRKGREALGADEVKSLRISDDTQGGYLAPQEFSAEVDKNIVQFSPVRQAARVGSTSSGSVIVPRRTGRPTAAWVGETETRSATEAAYGQVEIPIDEIGWYVDVSNKLLEDAAVDVGSEVAFDLAEEFGRAEGEAFISGNGVKKPLGLLNDTGLSFTVSGSAAAVTDTDGGANGLIDLFYALAPFYRQRGVFMANGKTIAALRKMKDGQKQYLWQPSVAVGQPETFLGRPIVEAVDLPDGQIIDRLGYDSLTYVIAIDTVADADATFAVLLEESDASDMSGAGTVANADLISQTSGTAPLTAAGFQFDDDNEVRKLGYVGNKRYTRLTITPVNNASAALLSAVAILGNPGVSPVTQAAA